MKSKQEEIQLKFILETAGCLCRSFEEIQIPMENRVAPLSRVFKAPRFLSTFLLISASKAQASLQLCYDMIRLLDAQKSNAERYCFLLSLAFERQSGVCASLIESEDNACFYSSSWRPVS